MHAIDATTTDGRRWGARLAAVVGAGALLCTGQALSGDAAQAAECPAPIRTVLDTTPATAERTVALTFDDGPLPQNTPDVLDVLRANGVKATFFVRGDQAAAHPDLVQRIVDEGHAIGNHTWSHPDLSQLTPAARTAQIERATQTVVDAVGTEPCFFRGPFGIHHDPAIAGLAWERGMTVADWSLDTRDWSTPASWSPSFQQQIIDRATSPRSAHPIVLMHDGGGYRQNTVAALDDVISYYASRGYTFTDPAGRAFPSGSGHSGTYVVQPGDTLSSIAAGYSATWQEIYQANRATIGPDPNMLQVGQRLTIPGAGGGSGGGGGGGGTPAPPASESTTYVVQPGDTLGSIASGYGATWREIYEANRATIGPNPNVIQVGQRLTIPGTGGGSGGGGGGTPAPPASGSTAYVVQPGDTLGSIASGYSATWREIYEANRATIGPNPNLIQVGQQLTIPAG
ncbi:LysM peptidoglycan-binding domain-containing protein [Modestobacter sp. VKM Ac-2984]|uniref:LysM peptidoglycan-binding domain-containing protein n=1 Tax=Modestobacter sp. VKM Ac-2984 TaxID=3004138 RepID=UPI0022AB4C07|nr:LysM peptidoglycan-binding domain-containing protein [Modestobacter sp. VKM Ac-2984]MCZ2818541.1 LysM peptidoglycan-binding domain-containing protein [Modestobacter sp. VKM Ac-2984]